MNRSKIRIDARGMRTRLPVVDKVLRCCSSLEDGFGSSAARRATHDQHPLASVRVFDSQYGQGRMNLAIGADEVVEGRRGHVWHQGKTYKAPLPEPRRITLPACHQ